MVLVWSLVIVLVTHKNVWRFLFFPEKLSPVILNTPAKRRAPGHSTLPVCETINAQLGFHNIQIPHLKRGRSSNGSMIYVVLAAGHSHTGFPLSRSTTCQFPLLLKAPPLSPASLRSVYFLILYYHRSTAAHTQEHLPHKLHHEHHKTAVTIAAMGEVQRWIQCWIPTSTIHIFNPVWRFSVQNLHETKLSISQAHLT